MRWERNRFVREALGHFRHARVEHAARIEHFGLARRPGAELAAKRTRMKITLRFLTRSFFHFAADTDLSIQFDSQPARPEGSVVRRIDAGVRDKLRIARRGVRIGLQLPSFFTLIIREEDKTVLVESF